jgi:hypothetical protein
LNWSPCDGEENIRTQLTVAETSLSRAPSDILLTVQQPKNNDKEEDNNNNNEKQLA